LLSRSWHAWLWLGVQLALVRPWKLLEEKPSAVEVAWLGVHSAFVRPRKILEKKASAGEAARLSTTETLVRLQSAWLPFLSLPLVYRLSNSSGTGASFHRDLL
jgi:hypothetical protein